MNSLSDRLEVGQEGNRLDHAEEGDHNSPSDYDLSNLACRVDVGLEGRHHGGVSGLDEDQS